MGHSAQHANGMVIGALGFLGGKQQFPLQRFGLACKRSLAPRSIAPRKFPRPRPATDAPSQF